ncbi:uncharacterized protein [Spinacia oleracea]|uniref:Uncharacterized protein isoform X1 n=1 Tax=Spinacia oleracea TaxID=3562 RepID=A0ABM3QJA2_SPIOL|nr:uncharacterized protein LOC110778263 isoform X1 [Spinacia oleracea]
MSKYAPSWPVYWSILNRGCCIMKVTKPTSFHPNPPHLWRLALCVVSLKLLATPLLLSTVLPSHTRQTRLITTSSGTQLSALCSLMAVVYRSSKLEIHVCVSTTNFLRISVLQINTWRETFWLKDYRWKPHCIWLQRDMNHSSLLAFLIGMFQNHRWMEIHLRESLHY